MQTENPNRFRGLADAGPIQAQFKQAAASYRALLAKGRKLVPFCNVTLDQAVDAIRAAGGDMDQFEARYVDFGPVHEAIENHFLEAILTEP